MSSNSAVVTDSKSYLLTIYTRVAFLAYTVGVGVSGIVLALWGPALLGGAFARAPWAHASLLRLVGASLTAVALMAVPLGFADDARTRIRALKWFAGAHALLALMLGAQQYAVGLGAEAGGVLRLVSMTALGFGFLALWASGKIRVLPEEWKRTTSVFDAAEASAQRVCSEYEEGIRRVAQQEERNRLARDLHDSIKQQLFVVETAAATAQTRMQVDTEGAAEALARIRVSAREAIDEMQALLTQLRAAPVERTGLVEALRRQCEALEHRTGAAVRFHAGAMPEPMALPSRAYENVYRVAQEALHNVGRHARARNVQVRLEVEGLQFVLEVRDDGAGFPANQTASKPSGMGIRNMRQRAEETGGNFELWSHPGEGTRIVLRIPLHSLDAVEHRRQAGVQGALLTVLVAFVMLRTPNPFVVIALPVAIVLGYHLRALWLARGAGAPQL